MLVLYNFGIKMYNFLIYVYHFVNKKADLWIKGRKNIFKKIEKEVGSSCKSAWFHFASLGEFEQGRPVLEEFKRKNPHLKIVITFFSPSGYELRKNYEGADHIFYLPLDTKKNAQKLIQLINPQIAFFTKYEFWYHYFKELNRRAIPLYLISGIFNKDQSFFKWYGALNRKTLSFVTHLFVQDEESKTLLRSIGLNNVSISGDTRFDRVAANAAAPKHFEKVQDFCSDAAVLVAGSTWPEDEKLIAELVKLYPGWKFVIAPHEIKEEKIKELINLLPKNSSLRYSEFTTHNSQPTTHSPQLTGSVLIIDNIGMLSSLYQYGRIAYIGGGFGVGIHNTLEAAAFSIPVIFGPNYQRFLEARTLLKIGGGFTISDLRELKDIMAKFQDDAFRLHAGAIAGNYVQEKKGATEKILKEVNR